jgi:hypothetical protein
MLTVHRGQEVKSMLKLKDANEISQRHRLSHSLTHSLTHSYTLNKYTDII